ncbi:MAG: FtsW/RodA/SpoVE family cell cycle protein [bacterium]
MNWKNFKNQDWIITILVLILQLIGLIALYSTTISYGKLNYSDNMVLKQAIFIILGFVIYYLILFVDFNWLKQPGILALIYIPILISLIYVKLFGLETRNVIRWIDFGFFKFQPSEFAKIVLILITAATFSLNNKVINNKNKQIFFLKTLSTIKLLKPLMLVIENFRKSFPLIEKYLINFLLIFPLIILTFIQPALGSALIIFGIWLILLLITFSDLKTLFFLGINFIFALIIIFLLFKFQLQGKYLELSFHPTTFTISIIVFIIIFFLTSIFYLRKAQILSLLLCSVFSISIIFGGTFIWNKKLLNYQRERILNFVNVSECDATDECFQVIKSQTALASGRVFGRGFLEGPLTSKRVLTQASTDFIFASIGEQFGFVGCLLILILFLVLILRIVYIGQNANSSYGTFVCLGIVTMLLIHLLINIGMNQGKLPVTGIPLPLISYGGSSIFLNMISFGIIQSISRSRRSIDIADNLMLRSHSLTI